MLAAVRLMLETRPDAPITFTSVSNQAEVSRRTLYTHWGSIDRLIADAVSVVFEREEVSLSHLPFQERLTMFLRRARNRLATPLTGAALSTLVPRAAFDEAAAEALRELGVRGRREMAEYVGPVSMLQYDAIVGPLFHSQIIDRVPLTDDQIDELVANTIGLLGTRADN